jgi:predicted dehydrogenase
MVPLGWHYKPFVQRAKEMLDGGGVGRVEYALCFMASATIGFYGGGDVPAEWESELFTVNRATYQQPTEKGGGHAWGSLIHAAALLLWITGLRASEVGARMRCTATSGVDLYNAATVLFDGGAIGDIGGGGTLPPTEKFQIDIRVFGDEGALFLDLERERLELRRHDGSHERVEIAAGEGAYDCSEPPNRFVDLILGRPAANESPGEVNARAVELVEAMYRSAAEGGRPTAVAAGSRATA